MVTKENAARPVVEALVAANRAIGLKVEEPKVLGARANVVVHALLWSLLYGQRFEADRLPSAERLRTWLLSQPG